MQTRIQKWGNSLAVLIPKSLIAEVRLEQDMVILEYRLQPVSCSAGNRLKHVLQS